MSVSSEDSARMIDLLDADHNGQISIDEFRRFVYLLPEAQACPLSVEPQMPSSFNATCIRVAHTAWILGMLPMPFARSALN